MKKQTTFFDCFTGFVKESQTKTLRLLLFAILVLCSNLVKAQMSIIDFYEKNNDTIGCESLIVFLESDIQNDSLVKTYEWFINYPNSTIGYLPAGNLATSDVSLLDIGCYDVKLVVTDSLGNTDTLEKLCYIEIFSNPVADFTASQVVGCGSLNVTLTSTSTGNINSLIWHIPSLPGSPFVNVSPFQTTISDYGYHLVELEVFTPQGCRHKESKNDFLYVDTIPIADFTWDVISQCDTITSIQFTSTSKNSSVYDWDFGDDGTTDSTNPNPTYDTSMTQDQKSAYERYLSDYRNR